MPDINPLIASNLTPNLSVNLGITVNRFSTFLVCTFKSSYAIHNDLSIFFLRILNRLDLDLNALNPQVMCS